MESFMKFRRPSPVVASVNFSRSLRGGTIVKRTLHCYKPYDKLYDILTCQDVAD